MTEPTATGKPYLVIIETQAGPQPQIWYEDHGRFVGCGHLKPVQKYPLPMMRAPGSPWEVDTAVAFITEKNHAPMGA